MSKKKRDIKMGFNLKKLYLKNKGIMSVLLNVTLKTLSNYYGEHESGHKV